MRYDFSFFTYNKINRWIGASVKIEGYTGFGLYHSSFVFFSLFDFTALPYTQNIPPIVQNFMLDKIEQEYFFFVSLSNIHISRWLYHPAKLLQYIVHADPQAYYVDTVKCQRLVAFSYVVLSNSTVEADAD